MISYLVITYRKMDTSQILKGVGIHGSCTTLREVVCCSLRERYLGSAASQLVVGNASLALWSDAIFDLTAMADLHLPASVRTIFCCRGWRASHCDYRCTTALSSYIGMVSAFKPDQSAARADIRETTAPYWIRDGSTQYRVESQKPLSTVRPR